MTTNVSLLAMLRNEEQSVTDTAMEETRSRREEKGKWKIMILKVREREREGRKLKAGEFEREAVLSSS